MGGSTLLTVLMVAMMIVMMGRMLADTVWAISLNASSTDTTPVIRSSWTPSPP